MDINSQLYTRVELNRPFRDVTTMCTIIGVTVVVLLMAMALPAARKDSKATLVAYPFPYIESIETPVPLDPPDDGELEIVESGYTPVTDLAGDPMISWAAIVANTSSTMTAASTVFIRLMDAEGNRIDSYSGTAVRIPNLMPGEEIGVGNTGYIDAGDIFDAHIDLVDTEWYEPSQTALAEGSITTSDFIIERVNIGDTESYWGSDGISAPTNELGDLRVTFTVTNTYPDTFQNIFLCAVYRNADGEIIGADSSGEVFFSVDYPPGQSIRIFESEYPPPPATDDDRTIVYPLP